MNKIFVSMGSYDEKYLYQTVASAMSNAKNPERLVFGIHNIYPDDAEVSFGEYSNQVRILNMKYPTPLGTGYARLSASILCPGDCKYILQIDSHMIFDKNWDEDIEYRYNEIKKDHDKFIITKYLMYWKELDGKIKKAGNSGMEDCDPYKMDRFDPQESYPASLRYNTLESCITHLFPSMIGYQDTWSNGDTYKEQVGVSGHFMFSESSIIKDLLYDPLIPWASDEVVFSLRAYTRGYKIFTIRENIAWHLDKDAQQAPASGIDFMEYVDPYNKMLGEEYDDFYYRGIRRIKDLILGEELGFWGAPDKESLEEYYRFTEFDFVKLYSDIYDRMLARNDKRLLRILYDVV